MTSANPRRSRLAQPRSSFQKSARQLIVNSKFRHVAEKANIVNLATQETFVWPSPKKVSNYTEIKQAIENTDWPDEKSMTHHQRLAKMGEFSAMMVHELRNPLTTVLMGLDHLKSLDLSPDSKIVLELALAEGKRLKTLLSHVLSYAKPQQLSLEQVELNDFIETILDDLAFLPVAANRQLTLDCEQETVLAQVDPDKFRQILINLVSNACEAIAPGESVSCKVVKTIAGSCIQIQNSASAIPPDRLQKLTEPFYSTKSEGTGLGLAIVKQLVEAHQGDFIIESNARIGFCARIKLPAIQSKQKD